MSNDYSIYYENKIIATAWLTEKEESEFQLVTIRPEGYLPDQSFTEKITLNVPATLKDTIAIERAIHLCGLNPDAFTISQGTQQSLREDCATSCGIFDVSRTFHATQIAPSHPLLFLNPPILYYT